MAANIRASNQGFIPKKRKEMRRWGSRCSPVWLPRCDLPAAGGMTGIIALIIEIFAAR